MTEQAQATLICDGRFHAVVGSGDAEATSEVWRGLMPTLTFDPVENGSVHWVVVSGTPEETRVALKALLACKKNPNGPYVHVSGGQAEDLVKKVSNLFPGINFRVLTETTILVDSQQDGKVDPLMKALRRVTAVKG